MPKIPISQPKNRLRPQNPTGFQSSSGARLQGDAVASAGKALSSFGGAIDSFNRKEKAARGIIAQSWVDSKIARGLQDESLRIAQNGSNGDTDMEDYDNSTAKLKIQVLKEASAKFGDDFNEKLAVKAESGIVNFRAKIGSNTLLKKKTAFANSMKENVAAFNSEARNNPDDIDMILTRASVTQATTDMILNANPTRVRQNDNNLRRELLLSATEGLKDQGKFDQALDLVANRYSGLFGAEQKEIIEGISTARLDKLTLDRKERDRVENEQEKIHNETQTKKSNLAMLELIDAQQSGDLNRINRASKNARDLLHENDLPARAFGGLLSQDQRAFKVKDSLGSLDISKLVYNTKGAQLDKAENLIDKLETSQSITAPTSQNWRKIISSIKNRRATDPAKAKRYEAARTKLTIFTKPDDVLKEDLRGMNPLEQKARLGQVQGARAALLAAEANGDDPEKAFRAVIDQFYPGIDSVEPYPGAPETNIIVDELSRRQHYQWGKSKLLGTSQWPAFERYHRRVLGVLEADEKRKVFLKDFNQKEKEQKESDKIQERLKATESALNFLDNLLDPEQHSSDEIAPILYQTLEN